MSVAPGEPHLKYFAALSESSASLHHLQRLGAKALTNLKRQQTPKGAGTSGEDFPRAVVLAFRIVRGSGLDVIAASRYRGLRVTLYCVHVRPFPSPTEFPAFWSLCTVDCRILLASHSLVFCHLILYNTCCSLVHRYPCI